MKLFCVVSSKKEAGKTHFCALALSGFLSLGKVVSYYKPFIMNAIGGKLFDVDYIKRKTNIEVKDIYTTFATASSISPMNSIDEIIDTEEITDTIEEMKKEYSICLLETIGLYDPINEDETQTDLLYSIKDVENNMSAIVVSAYDENVISSTLMLVEAMHLRKIKTSLVVINQITDCIIDENVTLYIREQIKPVKLIVLPFDNTKQTDKFNSYAYSDIATLLDML